MAAHDERPRGNEGASSEQVGGTASKSSATLHQSTHLGALHVIALPYRVVARSGRARWLLVYRCGSCAGGRHVAQARELADVLVRTAPCGQRVALHAATEQVAA